MGIIDRHCSMKIYLEMKIHRLVTFTIFLPHSSVFHEYIKCPAGCKEGRRGDNSASDWSSESMHSCKRSAALIGMAQWLTLGGNSSFLTNNVTQYAV